MEIEEKKKYSKIVLEQIEKLEWLQDKPSIIFKGKFNEEIVIAKKVKQSYETDIHILVKLNHPNMIQYLGLYFEDMNLYLVMEFYCLGSVYNLIQSKKLISFTNLSSWSKQIAAAMKFLHENNIIHGNLKSSNVIIKQKEIVKITDYNISFDWDDKRIPWMAPEIIKNESFTEKIDIWSYGVVLWELLNSETPFKGVDIAAYKSNIANNTLRLPIPSTCLIGYRMLIEHCWLANSLKRPSFEHIEKHLLIADFELENYTQQEYFKTQKIWKQEIQEYTKKLQNCNSYSSQENLMHFREKELEYSNQAVRDEYYDKKLSKLANDLYMN